MSKFKKVQVKMADNRDIHKETASELFGVELEGGHR